MEVSELGGLQPGRVSSHWVMPPMDDPVPYPPPVAYPPPLQNEETVEASTSGLKRELEVDVPPIDVQVRNVVTSFNVRSHVNLRELALRSCHVYYERSKGVVVKQIRSPKGHVKIWSSGKVVITGCVSEEDALICSKKIALMIKKRVAPRARFANYRIANILATCKLGIGLRIDQTQYEPELMVGLIWRSETPKAVLRIHTTGSITITGATSTETIQQVLETVYPLLLKYKSDEMPTTAKRGRKAGPLAPRRVKEEPESDYEEEEEEEFEDGDGIEDEDEDDLDDQL